MRKILITGKNSYIGNHIQNWLEKYEEDVEILQLDVKSNEWEKKDFREYDSIIHVAGIVHQPSVKEWELYKKVNIELPLKIADKAKKEGVHTFIFISTMAVYGIGKKLHENLITNYTSIQPTSMYGKSKYIAEQQLQNLSDETFHVIIVRPPNVYGRGCKGGYITGYANVIRKLPVIPSAFKNVRQSVIYIDNLSELIRLLLRQKQSGIFTPQDDFTPNAVDLMYAISLGMHRPKKKSRILGFGIYCLQFLPIIKKAYGGVEYDREISTYDGMDYVVISFEEGIRRTLIDDEDTIF